jgi:dihydrofolate synthase/folylpolyglutamate synthase
VTFNDFTQNLNARGMFRIRPSLRVIRKVLRVLGDPQDQYPTIHIAGTNGKGSVAAALESVLRANGYRTGLYTSPHLIDLRERVRISGTPFLYGFTAIAEHVLRAEQRAKCSLTYFELLTAIAFQSFAVKKVDIAVIECGLGGQWDATNTIKKPLLSIITSIGLDHTEWLGQTEREIAVQKSGIIKPGTIVISGVRGKGRSSILNAARQKRSKIYQIDTDYRANSLTASWRTGKQILSFLYKGSKTEMVPFGLMGTHQIDNAAIAITASKILKELGYRITAENRDKGLRHVVWPGRLQLLPLENGSTILLDGAHNPAAMSQLLRSIKNSIFRNVPKTFLFSAFKDKDFVAMGKMMTPLAAEVCLCALPKPRGATLAQLRSGFRNVEGPVREFKNPISALQGALQDTPRDGLVVVTGSLSLVGHLLSLGPSLRTLTPLHV